ncbi:MAG: nitroreductase family deazaflavin-dependent oxidoreductase [Actinobacteria bacterium]|nr:nitroreductase family deazaflavin-dependent oxidoreductase [Actinomycetota bacterium]
MASRAKIAWAHANAWIYAKSHGRLGGSFGGHKVLLLTTTGRKSGQPRRTPVQYEVIDGQTIIVAAGGGSPNPPQWFLNARANPNVTVQTGAEIWRAVARISDEGERAILWPRITTLNPLLAKVQERAGREIPVVRLERVDPAGD